MKSSKKTNNNTGIEYEYGTSLFLLTRKQYVFGKKLTTKEQEFLDTILSHPKIAQIREIADAASIGFKDFWLQRIDDYLNRCEIIDLTQNDHYGPADTGFFENGNYVDGPSVKYNNTCQANISGKTALETFGSSYDWNKVKETRTSAFILYNTKMYGSADNWFRQNKRCPITSEVTGEIRDTFIDAFNSCKDREKRIQFLKHGLNIEQNTPSYFICKYVKRKGRITMKCTDMPNFEDDTLGMIKAGRWKGYVGFFTEDEDKPVFKMQVKFNNGFLEEAKETIRDRIDLGCNIYARVGNPLTSWNFSLCR